MHLVPSEYATIQAGVDAASPGDTILVAPGVYSEAVVVTGKYVHLEGVASDSVTIDAFGLAAPCLTIDGPAGGQTVVRGFTLYRADCQAGALFITNAASALIESCCMAYNRATASERGAVSVASGSVVEMRSNRVEGNLCSTSGGIAAVGATLHLAGNLFLANGAPTAGAVYARNCVTELRHNTILKNDRLSFGDPAYCAVWIYDGISITMVDNIVALNAGYGVVLRDPITYSVEYNDVFGNPYGDYHTQNWSADPGASPTNISVDPDLVAPEYLPATGSPVAGAGSAGGNIGLDSAAALCSPDAVAPVCGNGVREVGEECDDGNTQSGDGCSSSCRNEGDCPCVAAGDVNCDGVITSADIIGLVVFVFRGGTAPCDGCTSPLASQC